MSATSKRGLSFNAPQRQGRKVGLRVYTVDDVTDRVPPTARARDVWGERARGAGPKGGIGSGSMEGLGG